MLSLQRVLNAYQVERVHRVHTDAGIPSAPPRTILVWFLNFRGRKLILAEVRKQQTIRYDSAVLHFFLYFSLELQKCRRSFLEVQKKLREKGFQYSMLYSSKMRVQHNGSTQNFDTSFTAMDWWSPSLDSGHAELQV